MSWSYCSLLFELNLAIPIAEMNPTKCAPVYCFVHVNVQQASMNVNGYILFSTDAFFFQWPNSAFISVSILSDSQSIALCNKAKRYELLIENFNLYSHPDDAHFWLWWTCWNKALLSERLSYERGTQNYVHSWKNGKTNGSDCQKWVFSSWKLALFDVVTVPPVSDLAFEEINKKRYFQSVPRNCILFFFLCPLKIVLEQKNMNGKRRQSMVVIL